MPTTELDATQTRSLVDGLTHEVDAHDWEGRYCILTVHPHEVDCDHGYPCYSHARRTASRAGGKGGHRLLFLLPSETGSLPWQVLSPHLESEGSPLSCTIDHDGETADVTGVAFSSGGRTLLSIRNGLWTE